MIDGAAVQAEVVAQIKGEKVIHFVKRRRKHSSKRTKGHRQKLTLVKITDILSSGAGKSGIKAAVGSVSGAAIEAAAPAKAPAKKKAKTVKADIEAKMEEVKTDIEAKVEEVKAKVEAAVEEIRDDLKKLSGVGPALEKKLHDAGVTTFAHIAEWTDEHIAELDEKLSFKGRIQREDWIAQAKKLIKG
jgi:large subunit ribosomal protein L21